MKTHPLNKSPIGRAVFGRSKASSKLQDPFKPLVKAANEAGGYGMLIGPQASRRERAEFRKKIEANPRNYIAQPRIELSTCPTWTPSSRPRHC